MADTEAHARAAADAVKVEYEVLSAYMDGLSAIADDAVEIHPGTPEHVLRDAVHQRRRDCPDHGIRSIMWWREGFFVQRQPHLVLEPDVGLAYPNEDGWVYGAE